MGWRLARRVRHATRGERRIRWRSASGWPARESRPRASPARPVVCGSCGSSRRMAAASVRAASARACSAACEEPPPPSSHLVVHPAKRATAAAHPDGSTATALAAGTAAGAVAAAVAVAAVAAAAAVDGLAWVLELQLSSPSTEQEPTAWSRSPPPTEPTAWRRKLPTRVCGVVATSTRRAGPSRDEAARAASSDLSCQISAAPASASWLSGGFSQRQSMPQAAPSFDQPRPISRLGRINAGRPHRPCIRQRAARSTRSSSCTASAGAARETSSFVISLAASASSAARVVSGATPCSASARGRGSSDAARRGSSRRAASGRWKCHTTCKLIASARARTSRSKRRHGTACAGEMVSLSAYAKQGCMPCSRWSSCLSSSRMVARTWGDR
eukprot:scaffold63917_cov52-Phaeocystis_antarctica.AAC.4